MTPQSELTRLLGIPPELWEGELKGMSDEELEDLFQLAEDRSVNDLFFPINCELIRRLKAREEG